MGKSKKVKEPQPILVSIFIREKSTGTILVMFPTTRTGEKQAERYRGLADLEIVKKYEKGGKIYEVN